jgi:large subunit GTPase 1
VSGQVLYAKTVLRLIPMQAELADRDFTAERYQPVVISTSAHSTLAAEQSAALRAAAEARNVHKLCIPRRPEWDASTTPEQLDAQEKAAFLNWRRCGRFFDVQFMLAASP